VQGAGNMEGCVAIALVPFLKEAVLKLRAENQLEYLLISLNLRIFPPSPIEIPLLQTLLVKEEVQQLTEFVLIQIYPDSLQEKAQPLHVSKHLIDIGAYLLTRLSLTTLYSVKVSNF
jgi:hypothetical protein